MNTVRLDPALTPINRAGGEAVDGRRAASSAVLFRYVVRTTDPSPFRSGSCVVTTQPSKFFKAYGTLSRTRVVFAFTRNDPHGATALPLCVSHSS
jgi:hypothetical protein